MQWNQIHNIFPHEVDGGGKPLTQGDVQVLSAAVLSSWLAHLAWIPDMLQFIILFGTAIYVVFRAVREINKLLVDIKTRKASKGQEEDAEI